MTLIETVMASLVFSLSAAASLHLLELASVSVLAQEQHQQRSDQLESELVAFEGRLRQQLRQMAPMADCQLVAGRWLLALQSPAPGRGLRQELSLSASGEALQLRLAVAGLSQTRQRAYHPAAFGLCPTPTSQEVSRASL
ncbi:MAG: hypothetical protein NTY67_05340 [Cyanobacteria bacterium]|nr:hypothetical protein [Cyanobacteriota bacterium]